MSTDLNVNRTAGLVPAAGGRDRRAPKWPRRIALILAIVVVAAVSVFGVRYVIGQRSRPIVEGSGPRGARGPTVRSLGTFNDSSGSEILAFEAVFSRGESFSYWVDLYNEGSRTVTISHVGPDVSSLYSSGKQWEIEVQIADPSGTGVNLAPWHDITLPPQRNVETLVTVRMTGCMPKDSTSVFGDTPVTYTVWGATVHAVVPMDFSVTMKGIAASHCGT